jgi:chloramphenicol-sensitive protein RarD
MDSLTDRSSSSGTWLVVAAYVFWGMLPIYWKLLSAIPPFEVLSHRIFWSFVFACVLLWIQKRWKEFRDTFSQPKNRAICLLTAAIVGSNWFIYIWAISHDHIVDTSLGYFINPLIAVLLGLIFLKEKLTLWQVVAFVLAFLGVGYLTVQYGKIPWISLSLAFTFGFYALIRKTARLEALVGLTAETAILSPLLLAYLVFLGIKGTGAVGVVAPHLHLLLLGAGIVTATPLLWFTLGVRKIPLSRAGFLQYIAPSLQLFIGVVVYSEPFTQTHLISFGLIWLALLIYSLSTTPLFSKSSVRSPY